MRYLLLIILSYNISFSYSISCKGDLKGVTIYDFSTLPNSGTLTFVNELDEKEGLVYGELDVVNYEMEYYDDRSAICGGEWDYNKDIYADCNSKIFLGCWDVKVGISGFEALAKEKGVYTNKVVMVDGTPCFPYNVQNVTVGAFDYDNKDIALVNYYLNNIVSEDIETLTQSEAEMQRSYCKEESIVPYIDDWEQLLVNQRNILNELNFNLSSSIFDISERLKSTDLVNDSLENLSINNSNASSSNSNSYDDVIKDFHINPLIDEEINSFQENIKNKFSSLFSNYSNVFGFSGYSSAPTPINFSLFGKNYTAFDVTLFDEYITNIRKTLISFSYIWGFILVFRSIK